MLGAKKKGKVTSFPLLGWVGWRGPHVTGRANLPLFLPFLWGETPRAQPLSCQPFWGQRTEKHTAEVAAKFVCWRRPKSANFGKGMIAPPLLLDSHWFSPCKMELQDRCRTAFLQDKLTTAYCCGRGCRLSLGKGATE